MARRGALGDPMDTTISRETYSHLVSVMNELAARGPMQEELVMRVANAGEFVEVIKEIKSRRINRKKFAGKPAAPGAAAAEKAVANRGKGKGRKGRKGPQPVTDGRPQQDTGADPSAPAQQELGV